MPISLPLAVLEVFPPRGIDQSMHVAVLLGVLVVLLLTETLGWVYAGLVVPGYLASVFAFSGASGAAVVIESVLTYGAAAALSRSFGRTGAGSEFFGRDRFFLITLLSVVVRQLCEVALLPALARAADARFGTALYGEGGLSSVGLVLVPLTANTFWKLGLRRGMFQTAVPVAVVYVLLRFVLLRYTNLSYASLALTYEDAALDFLGSAKAYIILLLGAWYASRLNLEYGWDFNGIMVPALIALAWFSPLRVLTTLLEALILAAGTRAFTALPRVRTMNLEGPRKIALVFTLGFSLKFALGWLIGARLPGYKLTDISGFGYLLPSLLATKVLQKRAAPRVLLPTLQVSALAFAGGSLVGLLFDAALPAEPPPPAPPAPARAVTQTLARSPLGAVIAARLRARRVAPLDTMSEPTPAQVREYGGLWADVAAWLRAGGAPPAETAYRAATLGLSLAPLPGAPGAYLLREREESLAALRGYHTAVLFPDERGPVIEAARPASEWPSAEAAAALCARLHCRALLVAGLDPERGASAGSGEGGWELPERAWIPREALQGFARLRVRADVTTPRGRAVLHVGPALPADLPLRGWWPGELSLRWDAPPGAPRWPDGESVVLRAHPDDLLELAADAVPQAPERGESGVGLAAYFDRARAAAESDAPRLPPRRVDPSETELRFVLDALAPALLRAAARGPDAEVQARWAAGLAALVGYEVRRLPDCAGPGAPCWVLAPHAVGAGPGWGALAVREGTGAQPVALEVPDPGTEAGTAGLGLALFSALDARVLLLAGAGVGDAARSAGPHSAQDREAQRWLVDAWHQALHRDLSEDPPHGVEPLILEVRGASSARPMDEALVVGLGRPATDASLAPTALVAMLGPGGALAPLGAWALADGSAERSALSGWNSSPWRYSDRVGGARTAILWFAAAVRARFAGSDGGRAREILARGGVPAAPDDPELALYDPPLAPPGEAVPDAALAARLEELLPAARRAAGLAGPYALRTLQALTTARGDASVRAGYAPTLAGPYVLLELRGAGETLRAVVGAAGDRVVRSDAGDAGRAAVRRALALRAGAVVLRGRAGAAP